MPLYEYRCEDCGHEFEDWKSISRRDEAECPTCKSAKVKRLVRAIGLIGGSRSSAAPVCTPARVGGG
jgi:putative FmdB family regulatory protein